MQHLSSEMQECIQNALDCHATCLSMMANHCLAVGGKHVEQSHFKIMMDCAQICITSADFMARQSDHHPHICAECAEICEACATSCEAVGDMQECVDACRKCAASCGAMGQALGTS